MAKPIDRVRGKCPNAKKVGDEYRDHCPVHEHEDRNPSFYFRELQDGRVLVHCHGGCSKESVLAALGLEMKDLYPDDGHAAGSGAKRKPKPPTRSGGRTFATKEEGIAAVAQSVKGKAGGEWVYHYADGAEAFHVVRFDLVEGKTLRPLREVEGGWSVSDPPGKLPLYRLPDLKDAERVYVVEGEKCAEAGREIGLVCTTSAHGAQSPERTDWSPLAGKDVAILPDADEAGAKFAETVGRILLHLDPPARVRIVELPGLPDGGDIVEFIEAYQET